MPWLLCAPPRSQHFEAQQAALHQQLLLLQDELAAMKHLYDSLLEQVGQQNGFIQELRETPKPEEDKTEPVGQCWTRTRCFCKLSAVVTRLMFPEQDGPTETPQKIPVSSLLQRWNS